MANVQTASRPRGYDLDPFRWLWRLLTSVRFALALIGFLALAALIGILIPQVPSQMRDNPAAISGWLALQETRFGFLTGSMERLGLFEVFRSIWFVSGLGALVLSVCVCTVNRFAPILRNVAHPQARVPDEYLERGDQAFSLTSPDVDSLAAQLRHRRYRVTTTTEGNATYLFADRFPWAQFATFVSHLALILFLAGGLVTLITSKEQQVLVAEGENALPVFALSDPNHMQLYIEDAIGRFDDTGFPLDYRSELVVYKDGEEVARGTATVNNPLRYDGFNFHQTAYFPDGAALSVRDLASGRLIYDEVLALTSGATTPRVVIRDAAGGVLIDDVIVPTDFINVAGTDVAGTIVGVPQLGREFWIGARPGNESEGWQLIVFETANVNGARAILRPGETQTLDGLSIAFAGLTSIPSTTVRALPGADGESVVEISDGPSGKLLTIGPVQGRALALSPNQPVEVGGYEYTFLGQREFAGITVRRDPGTIFIWLATGLFLLGLALTFYTPRRRLWGKIADGQAIFRGLGGRPIAIEREVRLAASRAEQGMGSTGQG